MNDLSYLKYLKSLLFLVLSFFLELSCSLQTRSNHLELEKKYDHALDHLKNNQDLHARNAFLDLCNNDKHFQSCSNTGSLFHKIKHLENAKHYYSIGCNGEDGFGCFGLGILLEKSEPTLSISFMQKSCKLTFPLACEYLKSKSPMHQKN
jgi:hypothetical protein